MEKGEMELSGGWDLLSSTCSEENENNDENGSLKETECKKVTEGSAVEDIDNQENADGNDSSSDIDIIDETMEGIDILSESIFIPSSLPISSVENICESSPEETVSSPSEELTTASSQAEEGETTPTIDVSSSVSDDDSSFMSWRVGGRNVHEWLAFIWEYLQSLTGFQVSCLFGLTFCIYCCITINQTNIIALQEKGNVVSQMEKLVDDLRNDNKHLQEKMLSEMKNDKLVSSFEHQIRELKKENSKLNHMLHDVVKVLEKQKDTQEKLLVKKESDYQAPFKKEINKLKEHINLLKFDNEELQQQLVRMRYSSYSQGNKHGNVKDKNEHEKYKNEKQPVNVKSTDSESEKTSKDDVKTDETKDNLPLDILQLRKWNELLDQLAKEYGIVGEDYSTTEKKGWTWKDELKSKLKKPTAYVSNFASFYSNFYTKMFSDVYKSASDYLVATQKNVRSLFKPAQDQNKEKPEMSNIINDLGKKLVELKKKILSTYNFEGCPAGKDSKLDEAMDTNSVDPSMKNAEEDRERAQADGKKSKPENVADDSNQKWFFKRAQFREKLRETDEEETQNWFLRKKRGLSETFEDVEGLNDKNQKQEF